MPRPRQSDHAHVVGMVWATRVTSIAMQMAVPAGLGYWADRSWGTTPWMTIAGACLGGVLFALEVVRLAQGIAPGHPRGAGKPSPPSGRNGRSTGQKKTNDA